MAVWISMLRGVNLASHNRVRMEDLRSVYESLGLGHPQTYIQSGNVIFEAAEEEPAGIGNRIEQAISLRFGFRSPVLLRTAAELRSVVNRNPFAGRIGLNPSKLLVTFLGAAPGIEICRKIRAIETDPEELRIDGRELYIYFPLGAGRTKLPMASIERLLKTPGTARNWNSVEKLLSLAEKREAAE